MTPNEQSLIENLFSRIRGNGVANRDSEAEALIGRQMTGTPGAAYSLVQAVIVQDEALKAAHARIQALEAAQQQGTGGGLGTSFLGGAPQQPQDAPQPSRWNQNQQQQTAPQGPWGGSAPGYAQPPQADAGGGFLRGALTTAAGVAGGALLFDGIRSLFHGGIGGGFGGGLGGFGGSPWGGQPSVIEETVINNYGDDQRDDNFAGNDPNVINADWQPDPNDDVGNDPFDDGNSFDNGDDSSWA